MVHGVIHLILNPSMELAEHFNKTVDEENQKIESYCKSRGYSPDVVMALKDLRSMHRVNEFHFDVRTPEDRLKAMAEDPNNEEGYRINDYGRTHPWKFTQMLRMAHDKEYFDMIDRLYNDEIMPFLRAEPHQDKEASG